MNKKELLEECKRRYPVGCVVECALLDSDKGKIKKDCKFVFDIGNDGNDVFFEKEDQCYIYVHCDGNWAKIISKPQSKQELLEAEYERVEKEQKIRAAKIAKIKADTSYKLHLEVVEGVLWIMYGSEAFGYINYRGKCFILSEMSYQESWEQWKANGMPVNSTPVEWQGGEYIISSRFNLMRTDIPCGLIYNFEYCFAKKCKNEDIQRYSNNTVKIF